MSMVHTAYLLLMVLLLLVPSSLQCPDECLCIETMVTCKNKKLKGIPKDIPPQVKTLQLNANDFSSSPVQRSNFTNFAFLEKLFLKGCKIRRIDRSAFVDMKSLKLLDLTDNNIAEIRDDQFSGLTLENLFLNGNKKITFSQYAFRGLKVKNLWLNNIELQTLNIAMFSSLSSSLRTLGLRSNLIQSIPGSFIREVIVHLANVRLDGNPFKCNCEIKFLQKLLSKKKLDYSGIKCASPPPHKGRKLQEIRPELLQCTPPSLVKADVIFDKRNSAFLTCRAQGDPAPRIEWITPTGRYSYSTVNESDNHTEAALRVTKDSDWWEVFTCSARNKGGKSDFRMNVSWPQECQTRKTIFLDANDNKVVITKDERTSDVVKKDMGTLYTLTELVCAIVGTFLSTLVICIAALLIMTCVHRNRKKRKSVDRNSANGGIKYMSNLDDMDYFEFKTMLAHAGQSPVIQQQNRVNSCSNLSRRPPPQARLDMGYPSYRV